MGKPAAPRAASNGPIPLPHDGPVNAAFCATGVLRTETQLGKDTGESANATSVAVAASVLHTFALASDASSYPITDVLKTLTQATHVHQQLQALQAFRSRLLQQKQCKQDADEYIPSEDATLLRPLYRVLLEWMLSVDTPLALRRAIASCLDAIECGDEARTILGCVLASILDVGSNSWKDPVHSLQEALPWTPMEGFLASGSSSLSPILCFLQSQAASIGIQATAAANTVWDPTAAATTERAVQIANLVNKTLLLDLQSEQNVCGEEPTELVVGDLQDFLWSLFFSSCIPVDRLSCIGVAYGRTLQWQMQKACTATSSTNVSDILNLADQQLSEIQRAAVLQGLTAVMPLTTSLERLMEACRALVVKASDPDVRLSALKGVRTLISRVNTLYETDDETKSLEHDLVHRLVLETLEVVLQAWENPPTRKLAHAIPALFASLVELLLKLGNDSLEELLNRLLAQPPNRKGRYLALEKLLPLIGASSLLRSILPSKTLLQDLLDGVGDHGHNTSVMADLWAKLLQQLLNEMKRQAGTLISVSSITARNELPNKPTQLTENEIDEKSSPDHQNLLLEWLDIWVPSLARSLISLDLSRRRQVGAFCLPRIVTMTAGTAARSDASQAFDALLQQVEEIRRSPEAGHFDPISFQRETFADRILWAELVIAQYASHYGLLKTTPSSSHLRKSVATLIPNVRLRWAVTHNSPTIRVVALQVMNAIVPTYDTTTESLFDHVQRELELWKYALPFSVKTDGQEYISSLLLCLLAFLDRLCLTEATALESSSKDCVHQALLPVFFSFVNDFLLDDIIVKKTGYPGTVASKEAFMLSLLECVLVFSSRDHPLAFDSKFLPKSGSIFRRRRLQSEEATIVEVQKALLSREVFASLFSLLHSPWDHARSSAFCMLASFVHLGGMSCLQLPQEYISCNAKAKMESRGVFLASSPRQREADTGARILAFLYHSLSAGDEKVALLSRLVDMLEYRLVAMKRKLTAILADDSDILSGQQLPLAHGIIHTLRLVIEDGKFPLDSDGVISEGALLGIFDRMVSHFCQAIRASLAIVADVSDGEILEGMDEALGTGTSRNKPSKSINPGAIGANGIFSSIKRSTIEDDSRLQASQRIIIGSWLLTKEACGAIAALLASNGYNAETSVYNEAGMLLVSTLTSLKHTGAAFAAHRAIQLISQTCFRQTFNQSLTQIPFQWASRLIAEVSRSEKIRDSTLRRSIGYSLGFLSLMRSEVSSSSHHPLCRHLMADILTLSLPAKRQYDFFTSKIGIDRECKQSLLSMIEAEEVVLVADGCHNQRTRVHALNTLRLILLDAPLSREVFPFVGVAIIASVIGYSDAEWSVRNSSTMVFAAAMLRSVDSDKNALNKDLTSSNAVTAHELFRSYPALAPFLYAVLKSGVQGVLDKQRGMSLPPILPILLLLARVQPVAQSGQDSVTQVEQFIPVVQRCLDHRSLSIRKSAARALRNLSSGEKNSTTWVRSILAFCQHDVTMFAKLESTGGQGDHWNRLHGSLLTMWELVQCSSEAKAMIRGGRTFDDLYCISSICNEAPIVPPPCLMIAIEIISTVMNKNDRKDLVQLCNGIIPWLDRCFIGEAELGASVASVAAKTISSILWDCSWSFCEKKVYLNYLSSMFLSDQINIRLAAVKTFKKEIYDGIDNVTAREWSAELFSALAEAFLLALKTELSRDSVSPDIDKTHRPTVRRLSRCLLECIDASIATRKNCFDEDFRTDSKIVAMAMLGLGNARENQAVDPDSLTMSDGNAVDLLAFALSEEGSVALEDQNYFSSLVARLSDPLCHWRIRHSAAVALQRCGLIFTFEGVNYCMPDSAVGIVPVKMLGTWLVLMQDADYDVRYAAARATTSLQKKHFKNDAVELACLLDVSRVWDTLPQHLFYEFLIIQLSQDSVDLDYKLDGVYEEFSLSRNVELSSPLNDVRKIFEIENPNSYGEICLIAQLAAIGISRVALSLTDLQHSDRSRALTDQLLVRTERTLSIVLSRLRSDAWSSPNILAADMMHEITRSRTVFPSLHNMLLGAIAIVYLGVQVHQNKVQQIAKVILSSFEITGTEATVVHPCILQALQVLASASIGSKDTAESLRLCCFLVPRQV